jgi:NAD(P)-dependent dehydrogenase (short-subunit alcohol dehydrogenase family)
VSPAAFGLAGKVVILTGASSGIGAAAAPVFHDAGAHVVLVARREERLAAVASGLHRVSVAVADVTDENQTLHVVTRTIAEHGRIDVLVNNAGVAPECASAEDETAQQFRDTLESNLVAAFTLSQQVGHHMLARGAGSIVNVSSVNGLRGNSLAAASYTASKAGLDGLTRVLAAQWGTRGVRVNSVAPGPVPSEINDYFSDQEEAARWGARTALGRVSATREIAGALLFLASDASSYVTGQVLSVDGGWAAT